MKKGLLLLNNKVEDVEGLATRALLTRHGYQITTFTLEDSKEITTSFGLKVKVDEFISDVKESDFDFLVLPGGSQVFNWVKKESKLNELIKNFNDSKKLIAAICAAPLYLNELDLLVGREFTSFPSVSADIQGKYQKDAKVVLSDNIITSRSAGTVYDFVFEIIKYFDGSDGVNAIKVDIVY